MICVDTNVFVDFFKGTQSQSTERLLLALNENQVLMSPFVLSELLSSPKLTPKVEKYLLVIPRIEIETDFFVRAGLLRRKIYQLGNGVSIADIYIAQCCIEGEIPLLSDDSDLHLIAQHSELSIVDRNPS